jgi:hypothetical protein
MGPIPWGAEGPCVHTALPAVTPRRLLCVFSHPSSWQGKAPVMQAMESAEEQEEGEEEWQDAAMEQEEEDPAVDPPVPVEGPAWHERDLSPLPLCSVSSFKAGFGVRELMEQGTKRYWQSGTGVRRWGPLSCPCPASERIRARSHPLPRYP